jgi:hypothetical protein
MAIGIEIDLATGAEVGLGIGAEIGTGRWCETTNAGAAASGLGRPRGPRRALA